MCEQEGSSQSRSSPVRPWGNSSDLSFRIFISEHEKLLCEVELLCNGWAPVAIGNQHVAGEKVVLKLKGQKPWGGVT